MRGIVRLDQEDPLTATAPVVVALPKPTERTAAEPTRFVRLRRGHVLATPDGTRRYHGWTGRLPDSIAADLARRAVVAIDAPVDTRKQRKRSRKTNRGG